MNRILFPIATALLIGASSLLSLPANAAPQASPVATQAPAKSAAAVAPAAKAAPAAKTTSTKLASARTKRSTARCHDAKGKFTKCAASTSKAKQCRDSKGRFTKCAA